MEQIRDLIRSITKNSDDYFEKSMKIKINSDDELLLNKTIQQTPSIIIAVRAFFMKITKIIHKFSRMNVCINYRLKRNKNIICKTKNFYILLALLIAVSIYCYLIKYKAKQKH